MDGGHGLLNQAPDSTFNDVVEIQLDNKQRIRDKEFYKNDAVELDT